MDGEAPKLLEKLIEKYPNYVTMALGDLSQLLAYSVRNNFLHGQALDVITGRTEKSVKAFYDKKQKAWFVRVGVGVSGSLNYLARWTGTEREFMAPAFHDFANYVNIESFLAKNVEEKIK